uniref:MI domain-containing protein n=2 Tax=Photinus pyralis TaxID=7054 RepID=A0A1Y1NIM6_PHOPY
MVSRYVNGPVKQEGICVFPPHPQHYRMIAHQRTEGYHVATPQSFVQQQPQPQQNNQVPPLRMPPAGPPTQSSTPPNTDLKVQSMTQQPSMSLAYVPQTPRGPASQNFFTRPQQQTTQNPRMPNHRQGQPPIFSSPSPSIVQFQPIPPVYINPAAGQYFSNQRTPGFIPGYQMLPNPPVYAYTQTPQSQAQQQFLYNSSFMPRPLQTVPTTPQNATQPPPQSMPLPQPPAVHTAVAKKRRPNAVQIIDPITGKDKLNELYEEQLEESLSLPPSGESSARETPQPPTTSNSKEIQATFAKKVAQAISKDEAPGVEEVDQSQIIEHVGFGMYAQPPPMHQKYETIVQSSKLQAATKEFVPAGLAKETTPVVSAITDAEEVTINTSNKQKDRDSPAKGRTKVREQTTPREFKEPVKEAPLKDVVNEKPVGSFREEIKHKDLTVLNVASSNKDAPVCSSTMPSTVIRDDKKVVRKDKTEDKHLLPGSVAATSEDSSDRPIVISPSSQPVSEVPVINAKSKNASNKGKDVQKQTPSQQQQQPVPVVPQPPAVESPVQPPPSTIPTSQPQKQSNKNNKLRELNMKGALKEGTDMDAFNDNKTALEDTTNANHPSSINNEYVNINNTNNVMLNNNSTPIINDIEQNETKDIMTISTAPETKNVPKSKVDVTDIIKEPPKLPKAEPADEPDCAVLDNEKLVQAKNEVNTKVAKDTEPAKPSLPYEDDQWSPYNQEGKKKYGRELLMRLRADPKSNIKPDNLPDDILANDERGRVGEISRYAPGGRPTDFVPSFSSSYPSKSSSQRGGNITKRKSQQGQIGNSNKGSKSSSNRLTISLKDDVKLREVENAWKPARFVASANMTEDEKKTEELYKKVRGVLNKLTPQKFNTLLEQIQNFSIDTTERLQGVIDLVFEKAVDEPNFSVAYASLCSHLALLKVPATGASKKDGNEFVNFRKLLITRCQLEFEKNSIDETERNNKVKEIEECTDPEKEKDLLIDLEEYDRRLRMKSVGNVRFIGELFKQHMLTVHIMERCLQNLLTIKNEESLECLCKLLTTVGKEMDSKNVNLTNIYMTMKELSDRKHGKISSRVRFMIQDVLDLRLSKWVPRRQDLNPKTMDQIQKEAENEQLNIQAMNAMPPMISGRREDRGSLGGNNINSNMDKKRRNPTNPEEWSSIPSSRNKPQQFTVQPDKLRHMTVGTDDTTFGSKNSFCGWRDGSGCKTTSAAMSTSNSYAILASIEEKNHQGMRQGDYYLKGSSMERYNRQPYDGRGSRSGSQHRSRDNSTTPRNIAPSIPPTPKPSPAPPAPAPPVIDQDLLDRKIKNILDEYLNEICLQDSNDEIKSSIPSEVLPQFISIGYHHVLERSQTSRSKTGSLFAYLIQAGTLSVEDYCVGLKVVLNDTKELIIDIPKVWDYVAELIVPVLYENAITFRDLYKCFGVLIRNGHASPVLKNIFEIIIQEKGPNFLQANWNSCGQKFSDYMPESQVDEFLKANSFEFMLGNDSSQLSPNHNSLFAQKKISYEEISDKLLAFFNSAASFDEINNWITANVGEAVKENQFIRRLTTAIFTHSIVNNKLNVASMVEKYHFFTKFVDGKAEYELQSLCALQSLLHKLEYPQGLLLQIFNKLYEDNVFSQESFIAWEGCNDPDEQEGKGVALKQLTCFITQVREGEDDSLSEDETSLV